MADHALCSQSHNHVPSRAARPFELASIAQIIVAVGLVCSFCIPALGQFVGFVPNTTSNSVTIFGTQLTTQAAPLGTSNPDNVVEVLGSSTGWKAPVRVAVLGDIPET